MDFAASRSDNSTPEGVIALQQNKKLGKFYNYIKDQDGSSSDIIKKILSDKDKLDEIGLNENDFKGILSLLPKSPVMSSENAQKIDEATKSLEKFREELDFISDYSSGQRGRTSISSIPIDPSNYSSVS